MNLLQINKYYSPDIGGVETVVKQYSEFASSFFENVTVLTVHKKFKLTTTKSVINGVHIIRCSSFGTFFSMPISFSFFFEYFKIRNSYGIAHFHEPFPLGSILLFIIPKAQKVVISWHSDIIKQKFFKKLAQYFQKLLCIRADVILTTSPNMINFSEVLSHHHEKTFILPLSINPEEYTYENFSDTSWGLQSNGYILFLGRLAYYKGINTILDSLESLDLQNIKLVIAGDGPMANSIKRWSLEHPTSSLVFINKHLSEGDKKKLLSNCLFFLFPSNSPAEAFGILQLEAMIYGKPIINTDLPTGVPWVSLNNTTGLTIPINNSKSLTVAINKLLGDRNLLYQYGKQAKNRVINNFSDNVVLQKLKDIYICLLSSDKR